MSKKWKGCVTKCISRSIRNLKSVEWGDASGKSLRFCFWPKRWLPFFVLDLVAVFAILFLVSYFTPVAYEGFDESAMPVWATYMFAAMASVGFLWFISTVFITGAIIHQSRKPEDFSAAWRISLKRYPALFIAMITVTFMYLGVSVVPVVGMLLSMAVSVIFLFVMHFVILGGNGFYRALINAVKAFRYKPLNVIITWLLATIFVLIIMGVFSLPLLITYASFAAQYEQDALIFMLVFLDMEVLYLEGAVLLIGFAISKVLALKFITEIYLQQNKKKFLVF